MREANATAPTLLSPDQVAPLLTAFSTTRWLLADLVVTADPGQAIKTCYEAGGKGRYVKYTSTGVHYGSGARGPHEVIRWAAILGTIRALPSSLRQAVAEANECCRASQREYRIFTAPAFACGCGRPPQIGPLTAQQQAYADAYDEWEITFYRPWRARKEEAERGLQDAIEACFADTADDLLSYAATLFD